MRDRLAARVAGTVMLAVGTVAASTTPVTANTLPPLPVPGVDSPLTALQRDLGLTLEQAQQRLTQEAAANQADELLRKALGGAFGGSHFDPALGKLVVGVTDPAKMS